MSRPQRLLVPSPSHFAPVLKPLSVGGGGFIITRRPVHATLVCLGLGIVICIVAAFLAFKPISGRPPQVPVFLITLVPGLFFMLVAFIVFTGASRSVTVDTSAQHVSFTRRRFWIASTSRIPLAQATLVTAPLLTVTRTKGGARRWNGHALYLRANDRTFALMGHPDAQRVAKLAQRLAAEHKLPLTSESATLNGIDG